MALVWMTLAGILAGVTNLCMRYHFDKGGSRYNYLIPYLFVTFLVTLWIYPMQANESSCDLCTAGLAIISGLAMAIMKETLGRAIQKGPAGLIYAIVNSSSVFPAFLFILFGGTLVKVEFNHWNVVGALLVILGLFWASRAHISFKHWLYLALAAGSCYLIFMVFAAITDSPWFLPITFGSALVFYFILGRDGSSMRNIHWGSIAGVLNGLCSVLFVYSISLASPAENGFIFPLFTVTIITVCNLWGRILYRESVNWAGNILCMIGIFVSAL